MEIALMPVGGDLLQIQTIQGLPLKGGVPYIFILKPQFASCPSADSIYSKHGGMWSNSVYGLPRRKIKDSSLCALHKSLKEGGEQRKGIRNVGIHDKTKQKWFICPDTVNH